LSLAPVQIEAASRVDIPPAVGSQDGPVHRRMQLPQLADLRRSLLRVVEPVVSLPQAFVVADHQVGAEVVVGAACCLEIGTGLIVTWEGKGLEAVGRCINRPVLKSRPKELSPSFMNP